jgi:exosortase
MTVSNPIQPTSVWTPGYSCVVCILLATASVPVLFWSADVWLDGILGGIAAAMCSIPICIVLAMLTIRQPAWNEAVVQKPGAEFALLLMGLVYGGVLYGAKGTEEWLLVCGILLPPMIWSAAWGASGWSRACQLTVPITFIWFVLPWEHFLRQSIDGPLQAWTADIALRVLQLIGHHLHYWNEHTIYTQDYYVIVNETCSGMNLLVTLTMYMLVFGWFAQPVVKDRLLLMLLVFPLTMLANGLRVAVIYLLGYHGGNELADGFWHTGSAYVIFLPVFWFIYVVNNALIRRQQMGAAMKEPPRPPTPAS